MAEANNTATRRASRCSKHAFAPRVPRGPESGVTPDVTFPAHRHQTCRRRAELASGSAGAGNDPVNQSDPTGEASTQDFWAAICGGLFDEIPYITALCGLFPGGISLPSVGPNPSAPLPGDENRGAIQIQGSSGSPKNNKGSPFDYSEPWSQGNPPTLDYGVILLDRLIAKTPEKIVKQRTYALAQALDYMVRCSQHFGCYPPGKPRGWYDPGNHPSQRVDIPIFDGTAFINDEGVQLTSLSSQGSLLCEGREVVT